MPQMLPMSVWVLTSNALISLIFILTTMNFMVLKKEIKVKKNDLNEKSKKSNPLVMTLFSSFDPETSIKIFIKEMNWMTMILSISIVLTSFKMVASRIESSWVSLIIYVGNLFKISLKNIKDGSMLIFPPLFIFVLLSNLMGMNPNMFTPTSHIVMNLVISISIWMGFMMFGWMNFTKKMLSHLVPGGTPTPLISFMSLIELTSTVIRPITLSIRLMANMVSGHLLLTLIGNLMMTLSIIKILVIFLFISLFMCLEMGVAMIQAYVFCTLLGLYSLIWSSKNFKNSPRTKTKSL